jgi:hypothetical protein
MSGFKTYKVQVTFEMVSSYTNGGTEDYQKLVENDILSGVQNKIRLCLLDVKGLLFTNPQLTVLEK